MNRLSRAAAALCLVLRGPLASAQLVGGQVVDEHGLPARGAAVHLLDSVLTVIDSTMADSSGTFYLTATKAGKHVLRVLMPGLMPVYTSAFQLSATEFHQERIRLSVAPNTRVFFEFQVQERVTPRTGNRPPQYPASLRQNRVEGEVLLQFVVDSTGRPVAGTSKVLRSSHDEFTKAVLLALPSLRFDPARVNGHAVAQLVQMPFQFNLTR